MMILPSAVDLRSEDCPVFNQGAIGSCTAQYLVDVLEVWEDVHGTPIQLSRMFQYFNERIGTPFAGQDAGAASASILQAAMKYGVCSEALWPDDPAMVEVAPSSAAYADALQRKVTSYTGPPIPNPNIPSVQQQSLQATKQFIANSLPVGIIMQAREGIRGLTGALVTHPAQLANYMAGAVIGGHAMVLVGYDDINGWFIVRNSWGTAWGDNGYWAMPYSIFLGGDVQDLQVVTGYRGYIPMSAQLKSFNYDFTTGVLNITYSAGLETPTVTPTPAQIGAAIVPYPNLAPQLEAFLGSLV